MTPTTDHEPDTASEPSAGDANESLTLEPSQFDLSLHNAIVTIENPETSKHRTFKISSNREGKRFISLLVNGWDWQAFALVGSGAYDKVAFTFKKFQAGPGEKETDWQKFTKLLNRPEHYSKDKGLKYHISSRCRRCNGVLSHPKSLALGLGPDCAKYWGFA